MVNDVNVPYISLILWELFITYLGKTNSLTQILRPLSFLLIPEPALESYSLCSSKSIWWTVPEKGRSQTKLDIHFDDTTINHK